MSKKMWNKIFKSKTNKNSKTLQAANKINKRNSIYEEYQQLNAALDILPINEKFKENTQTPINDEISDEKKAATTTTATKIPQATTTNTFSKMVNTLTLKRSQNSNSSKDLKNLTGNGNEGKEKSSKKSELNKKSKSTTSLSTTTTASAKATATSTISLQAKTINQSTISNNNNNNISNCNNSKSSITNSSDHFSNTNSNSNFNTPYNASLNEQQQQQQQKQQPLTETIASTASLNLNLNNNENKNNNEYLACKQNLTNPTLLASPPSPPPLPQQPEQQQKRLSKIVIVVKKLDTITTTTATNAASSTTLNEVGTNLNNQKICIDRTNNSITNSKKINENNNCNNYNSNSNITTNTITSANIALETEPLKSSSLSEINNQNQLSINLNENDHQHHHNDVEQHQLHQHNEDRKLSLKLFDNSNNITPPTEVPETDASVQLVPCPICSRTFNPVTLRKHVGICEKMATKKRNIFDSSRQRREGTDLATYPLPKNYGLPEKATSSTSITQARSERGNSPKPAVQQVSSPVLVRKKPSEDLIRSTARASMRKAVANNNNNSSATTTTVASNSTTPSGNFSRDRMRSSERSLTRRGIQPPPAEQCPHCERCFGIKAYDRHVEWCKEKALQAAIKQGNSKNEGNVAKARLEARTKYKAPCLKTKRSINREKYSGAADETHDNDDTTKSSKSNGSKTQDLMSMSMTSSICSERNITNCRTGNINEPVTAAVMKLQSNGSSIIGSRKCTRDKSQTPQPPSTTNTKPAVATTKAITDKQQQQQENDKEKEEEEPFINLEIQLPEFQLRGEQMSTNAINKKLKTSSSSSSKTTKFDALTAAKIKPLKQKHLHHQQQQQQILDQENILQIYPNKSNQKLKTTDVQQINLPSIAATLEQKKSASDLSSFKTKCRGDKRLPFVSHKAFERDNDHNNDNYFNHNEVKFEAKDEMSADIVDLKTSLTFCTSSQKNKISEQDLHIKGKQIDPHDKITMEEYFEREDLNKEPINITDNLRPLKHPKYVDNEDVFELDALNFKENQNTLSSLRPISHHSDFERSDCKNLYHKTIDDKLEDLNPLKESTKCSTFEREDNFKESVVKHNHTDITNNSILISIPSLNIPQSPNRKNQKEIYRNDIKKEIDLKNNDEIIALHQVKNSEEYSDQKNLQMEFEIYKDCLTDSDELRLKSCKECSNNNKESKELPEIPVIEKSGSTNLNSLQESSNENSFDFTDFKESLNKMETYNGLKLITKHYDSPRTPKSLRLPRHSSPPPSTSSLVSRTTPCTPNTENSLLKSLNISKSKRKKVLHHSASCTTTFPMKAMIPLSKESLELCGVLSAPQIKTVSKNDNFKSQVKSVEQLKCPDKNSKQNGMEKEKEIEKSIDVLSKEIKVIKEPPQLKRNRSFTVSGLPDNYDPFLSAKRQLEELCSPTSDSVDIPTTPQTPQLPSMPATPSSNNKMSTSLILSSSTPNATPNLMTTSQIPQQTQKTPILTRSSSFRRTSSLRGPRRSPLLSTRPPLFAQKHRPTIQRGLSDEGPISTNFLKPEEYDEMPVRSVCVNDFAVNKSPRVIRRDTSASNRKQPLKLNINAANANSSSATPSPNVLESEMANNNTASKYVSKTDSLAVFLKYEHELEKLNNVNTDNEAKKENVLEVTTPSTASTISTPLTNLDGPLNAKELKDKSNNLSKQNSAKNIKADILAATESVENYDNNFNSTTTATTTQHVTNDVEAGKYGQVRLTPLTSKPATPLTKPSTPQQQQQQPQQYQTQQPQHYQTQQQPQQSQTQQQPQLTPLNIKSTLNQNQEQNVPKSPKPVALSSIFGSDNKTTKQSSLLYTERKNSIGSDYIDPKLINKCDNLPINLNVIKRTDFKHSDSDASETRVEHFSSSSSESSAPAKKTTSLQQQQHAKFLPSVKQQQPPTQQHQQQQLQHEQNNNFNTTQTQLPQQPTPSAMNSQRNSAEGRNLLKRRMRLGRNQFLYDASPEGDSCSADDEGANRSSLEGDATIRHRNLLKEHEKAFERLTSLQVNSIDAPFIPAFDDFDFEEFLSSFENDEEQFPLFKDCREFLMNRTSKKQRSMLMPNSITQNTTTNMHNNSTNFKKSSSPQTFPPLTPQTHSANSQHFQFPALPQHPKSLFNSFSLNTRSRNKYDELTNATESKDTFNMSSKTEEFKDLDNQCLNQKREIFISIETEQNDLDKSPISPNSIRNMVGNPQTVVEVEVDAAHDNKFSKISDDDTDTTQNMCRSKNFPSHLTNEHLPNVQLKNAKNLIQQMQEDFRQMGEEMSSNLRLQMEHRTAPIDVNMNTNLATTAAARNMGKINRAVGTPSGDAYGDSDELSSLDGYPLSSPNSRLGVSSKTSADSAYGSLSRQRSSELTAQRNSSRTRPMTSNTANTLINRPLTEETSLGRSRQLSASSSSSSEHALPPINTNSNSNSYLRQQQQPQHFYSSNSNNNNITNDLDDLMRYERNNNNNNNYDLQPSHPTLTGTTNSHSNLESLQQYTSNSTMSTSMKMSKFCHECGSKFLLDQAKFCMDCGVKRIVL